MREEIPDGLALVTAFANTVDVEAGTDELADVDGLRRWLAAHGHAGPAGEAELARVRDFRSALRDEIAAHHDQLAVHHDRTAVPRDQAADDGAAGARVRLNAYAHDVPVRIALDRAGLRLEAAGADGVASLFGALLVEMLLAERDGVWRRLKICDAETCREAFYDWSKNSSRRWCSMGVCGNRSKTRAYRERRRES
ncbi:CGNR zinc finger domain-containing protein [Catenuloplanes indicus]|uniref:RNA-binding Zn ribbon-like protein n=1 Tax=Catenuloplanes indicus TaxID=137267 RepID=A0AAE4B084_9ACTN|nr:CGNR zinc finger domain-containing protein [Catenuloplanes indicus]MDQ0369302.1 putative RNA-binding Zn ribbon-like protein [Catenuloplanes indicus]